MAAGDVMPGWGTNPDKSDTVRVSTNAAKPVGLYVGGAGGDVTLGRHNGSGAVVTALFADVPAGAILPIRGFDYVMATGTDLANGDFTVLWE